MSEDAGQVWPPAEPLTGEPVVIESDQRLSIAECPACDGKHAGLEIHQFNRPSGPFTHWFTCPSQGDPVPLSLMMLKDGEGFELNTKVCQAVAAAQMSGRYLIAVFYINHDNNLLLERTTHKFPPADFFESKESKGVMGLLRESLEMEVGPQQPAKMKPAGKLSPLQSLLGAAVPSLQQKISLKGTAVDPQAHPPVQVSADSGEQIE